MSSLQDIANEIDRDCAKQPDDTAASESALNDLLCAVEVNESCDYFGILLDNGEYYMQRKHELSGSDRPLDSGEKTIITVCKALISANKLIKELDEKYGT